VARNGRAVPAIAVLMAVGALSGARAIAHGDVRPRDDPAPLRLTLLGTGNPRPSIDRFGPSILVEARGRRILVDAGRGATVRLFQVGGREALAGIDIVLLTHLHSDHVVGLPDLWLTGWIFGRAAPLQVYGPPGTAAMMDHLERAFEFDIRTRRDLDERFPAAGVAVRATDAGPGVVVDQDGVRITAFAVDHGPVTPAYGYRIDCGGRSVVFSGDTRASETLIEQARGTDVLVHEVISPEAERRLAQVQDPAAIERIIAHHTTAAEAGRLFARVRPRLAVYSHIVPSPATARDLIAPTRQAYRGRLEVGHDLMTIAIGDRIEVGTHRITDDR
jgi:ribonuclease Z